MPSPSSFPPWAVQTWADAFISWSHLPLRSCLDPSPGPSSQCRLRMALLLALVSYTAVPFRFPEGADYLTEATSTASMHACPDKRGFCRSSGCSILFSPGVKCLPHARHWARCEVHPAFCPLLPGEQQQAAHGLQQPLGCPSSCVSLVVQDVHC